MPSLKKKVPPPPKEPGTHTNAEVKEALHARALRRTILVTAVVLLLLACLAVVSNAARDAVSDTKKPKLVLIVAEGLSPNTVGRAMSSSKAPFFRLLKSLGGSYSTIDAHYAPSSNGIVNLLTGSAEATNTNLWGYQSILGWLTKAKKRTVVAAPSSYWSLGTGGAKDCPQIGLFDTECSGTACPATNAAAYCNAHRKLVTCNEPAQLYQDELPTAFEMTLNLSADALYFQVSRIPAAGDGDLKGSSKERSEVNLLDAAVGRIAMALLSRTAKVAENWLLIVTSDGDNVEKKAPLLVAAYSNGEMIQLNSIPSSAKTSDVANTVKTWFQSKSANTTSLLGICTNGATVTNCKAAA